LRYSTYPWATLVEEGELSSTNKAWDLLKELGSHGLPGYLIKCEIAGGTKQNDECLINASHTPLTELLNLAGNATELPLVSAIFPETLLEKAELAKCSVGGAESGLVLGEDLQEALVGGTQVSLELSEEGEEKHEEGPIVELLTATTWGLVNVNENVDLSIELKALKAGTIFDTIEVKNTKGTAFELVETELCGGVLESNEICKILVLFQPPEAKQYDGKLIVLALAPPAFSEELKLILSGEA
jgi:hypothetical protein